MDGRLFDDDIPYTLNTGQREPFAALQVKKNK